MPRHPFDTEGRVEADPETGVSSYSYAFQRCTELASLLQVNALACPRGT